MPRRFTPCSLLKRPTRFVERIAGARLMAALVLLTALFPMVLFPLHEIGDMKPLDLRVSYSPSQAYEYLAALGADGRRAYNVWALTSDLAFPVVYSMALSVALMLTLGKLLPPTSLCLVMFPFLIVMADWTENLSLAIVTRAFPERTDTLVMFASFATSTKWTIIVVAILMLLGTAIYLAAKGMRKTG